MPTASVRLVQRLLPVLLLVPLLQPAQAVILSVGDDMACNHSSLQAAIDAAAGAGPHLIRLKTMASAAQQVAVSGKDITVRGGHADCSATTVTGRSTLDGSGGSAASVFTVTGSGNDVILENLLITGGDEVAAGSGGGIDFRGNGFLTLRNTVVSDNDAGYGGGIYFLGSGELRIDDNSLILRNAAQQSGGGVWISGDALMLMEAAGTAIQSNEALLGDGGGVAIYAPAQALIGSPGIGSSGAIFDNSAVYGGGIALSGADTDTGAYATLYSHDPENRLRVHGNRASRDGGGVYLRPTSGFLVRSAVYLWTTNVDIEDNEAAQGSAMYMGGDDVLARAAMKNTRFGRNRSVDINGQSTSGATVLMQERAVVTAERVEFRDNASAQMLRALGDDTEVEISGCLIVDNAASQHLLWQEGGGSGNFLRLDQCTIAGNTIGAAQVISSSHDFLLTGSIVDQPGRTTLVHGGGSLEIDDVIATETASLGSSIGILNLAPRFIDGEGGDYRLQAASPAVDFSGRLDGTDLDGYTRGRDLARVPNRFGAGDLGAYERHDIGNLIRNRGFVSDLRLWDEVRPGVSAWNSSGENSTGSVDISYARVDLSQPPAGILVGLQQCVRIPGPGEYRLTGSAYGNGPNSFERDRVSLRWAFRPDTGGEGCDGATASEGVVRFPTAPDFSPPTADGVIAIPAAQWTRNSVVVVSLAVEEGSLNLLATTTGHFDGISLDAIEALPAELFMDGFESP